MQIQAALSRDRWLAQHQKPQMQWQNTWTTIISYTSMPDVQAAETKTITKTPHPQNITTLITTWSHYREAVLKKLILMYYWISHNSQCHRRHTLSLLGVWYNLIYWAFLWNSQEDVTGSNKPPQTNQYQSIKRGSTHCTTTSICKDKTHKESKPKACHTHKFTHTNTPLAYQPFSFLFFLPTIFVYAQVIPSHQNVTYSTVAW